MPRRNCLCSGSLHDRNRPEVDVVLEGGDAAVFDIKDGRPHLKGESKHP